MNDLEIIADGQKILGAPAGHFQGNGLIVKPGGFQGWQGLPAGRREALARAVAHGEHDVPVYLPARVVTIDGWVTANSAHELGRLGDQIVGIGATGERTRVSVELYGEKRWAYGRRVSCEFDDSGLRGVGQHHGEFQLQFVFADPRKYGTETATLPASGTATSILVSHHGNFPAFPVVEIPSAPSSYTISAAGKTFTVTGATSGGTHVVHLRTGRVFRDEVEMPGVGRGDLWAVPVGAPLVHSLSTAGRVRIVDTFV